ncbi:hybrid non-ribosomal peptide synthetase/type I polyketide synthase [Paludifilum halophilum]|uniref:Non-ribosomal peptide synthetase n=1 Tax=Paludifilum halophilum TaxID=1642702 RepID=A0A235BBX8_9BACL|nr:hybrid non-ribosomal peptide synthetase/type I polyketide synthase [Paludifilum halophilum]OYD09085.1 non-ribosomal peptide synthetase [Paludifilum halophilum]
MNQAPKLDKSNVEDIVGLTPVQEGMLFHYLMDGEGQPYFEQLWLEIRQPIDRSLFEQAWSVVVESNEILRTVFRWEQVSQPIQVILKRHRVDVRHDDGSGRTEDESQLRAELRKRDREEPFNLHEVPFRVTLYKVHESKFFLLISFHHILLDGWSTGIILKEFLQAYTDLASGTSIAPLQKPKFKSFVKRIRQQDKGRQESFWREYLDGWEAEERFPLPKKWVKTPPRMEKYRLALSPEQTEALKTYAKKNQVTLASLFYSAWGLLLQNYADRDDILFGTTVSGRNAEIRGIEKMAGLFINTLPLRVKADGKRKVLDLVREINRSIQEREEYDHTPLVDIKTYGGIPNDQDPFDTLVVMENYPLDRMLFDSTSALTIGDYSMTEQTNYDLTVSVKTFGNMELSLIFNSAVIEGAAVESCADHLRRILEDIVARPGASVGEICMLGEQEKKFQLEQFNATHEKYPKEKTVVELFEAQAEQTPRLPAVKCGDEVLTYSELNQKANQLARVLRRKGVVPDACVGILADRSVEMVVACLGVLKAGGAYLPIDTDYPRERVRYLLQDSGAEILLTQQHVKTKDVFTGTRLFLDDPALYRGDGANLDIVHRPEHLVYTIYTSGTTGQPKGVMIEHRGLVNYLCWAAKQYVRGEKVNFPLYTSLSFDLTVTSLFTPLITGNTIVVYPGSSKEILIERIVRDNKVGVVKLTPSHLKLIQHMEIRNSSIKRLILGGEPLESALAGKIVEKFGGRVEICNEYGPTETVVGCMYHRFNPRKDTAPSVPIGVPAANVEIYILDRNQNPLPPGAVGELYIAGDGVARGYMGRSELTAEKFVPHPFRPERRMYKTGDLARFLPDGIIEFIGRMDEQIKLRGYRIEKGEIESRLRDHPAIQEAVAVLRRDDWREPFLTAYYVAQKEFSVTELRDDLLQTLPEYMIPSHFIPLEKIPLTANGKLDKEALPKIPGDRPRQVAEYVTPQTDMERVISEVWKSVLGLEQVGVDDKFFEVGGHSLNLIQVNNQLKEKTGREIPIVEMFNHPTIRSLAQYLTDEKKSAPPARSRAGRPEARNRPCPDDSRDIAVIGMSARFPGARNVGEFWENLKNGEESISFFSDEELVESGIDPDLIKQPNYVKAKGTLQDVEAFDPAFFGYSPAQAEVMDPQIRLLHECAWQALEDAGYVAEQFDGRIGLFAGSTSNYHWIKRLAGHLNQSLSEQFELGSLNDTYSVSTRIAHKLNLNGPAISLQTACSTSLVAVHLACQSLLNGESDLALAGGASILLPLKAGYLYQEGMVKSPDGHCRAFDAKARGTIGGDGVGFVVLKPLAQALADGDEIEAVIKGSDINNDGNRKVGYTAPSVEGQVEVIRGSLEQARVEPESITYVETHGSGTQLGDPIEIEALNKAWSVEKKGYCPIGSVKTNIGHLDAAAGVAGLIKAVLALKHRQIPPSLHFESPNPDIDFDNSPFYVNTGLTPWEKGSFPRRAAVNSFGMGGTNANVILEEAPKKERQGQPRPWNLLTLSARTSSGLERMTEELYTYLEQHPERDLADIAYTLQVGRKDFNHKRMLVAGDRQDALEALQPTEQEDQPSPDDRRDCTFVSAEDESPRVVFMFSGQGNQYIHMGRDLYREEPDFRAEMDHCFDLFRSVTGTDLKEILYPEEPSEAAAELLKRTEYAQPAVFIVEYALARLFMKWGIQPHAMIGYSFGELVAACLADVFSLKDGIRMIAARGKAMQQSPAGAMLSVPLPEEELRPHLSPGVSLAVVNRSSCIVSGTVEAIAAFERKMKDHKYLCMRLSGSLAAHSAVMDSAAAAFSSVARKVTYREPGIPYPSNLTGTWVRGEEATDPDYWVRHMTETVRFAEGIDRLTAEPNTVFLEIGPGRDLSVLVQRSLDQARSQYALHLLRSPLYSQSDTRFLLQKVGWLWLYGVKVDWEAFQAERKPCRTSLPTYPFERQRFWVEDASSPPSNESHLPLTVEQRLAKGKRPNIADWFYLPVWKKEPIGFVSAPGSGSPLHWLVFYQESRVADKLLQRLRHEGHSITVVRAGERFSSAGEDIYTINPREPDDYHRLLADLRERGVAFDQILHLWGLQKPNARIPRIEQTQSMQDTGFYSLLYLAQGLKKQGVHRNLHLSVVTCNMQSVAGEPHLHPEKATVLGPCLVLAQENPNIRCRNIDLTLPQAGEWQEEKVADQVLSEWRADRDDIQVCYRDHQRYVRTYEPYRVEEPPVEKAGLRRKGVYLITGGLGYIGLVLAEYLARTVQARLVLVGRSPFPPREEWEAWLKTHDPEERISRKIQKLQELESLGAEVLIGQADVQDPEQMHSVFQRAEQAFGTVHGVIYAAGVTGEESFRIAEQSDRAFCENHFQAKVYGLYVLEEVLENRSLDFCLLTSSLSPVLGGLGFSAYAAANLFLDAFVHRHNRTHPVPWVSVNFDGWQFEEEDRPSNAPVGKSLEQFLITPEEGAEVFRRAIALPAVDQMIASTGDLQARIDKYVKREAPKETSNRTRRTPKSRGSRNEAGMSVLEQTLVRIWEDFFGMEPLGRQDDFFDLGGDSLRAITMISKIHQELDVEIALPDFFKMPTIEQLAAHIRNTEKKTYPAIEPAPKREYYELSSAQKRLYLMQQMDPGHTGYNEITVGYLEGTLDRKRFEETFQKMIQRHESLRTSFQSVEGTPVQVIHDKVDFAVEYYDVSTPDGDGNGNAEAHAKARQIVREFVQPFDLACPPLLRAGLIKVEENGHVLMLDMHHIISDGLSQDIFVHDFMSLYEGHSLPELKLQYKDFSEWQNRLFQTAIKEQGLYWQSRMKNLPTLQLPADFSRPAVKSFAGSRLDFAISADETQALKTLASEEDATLFMVLLAVYNTLLYKLSGQEDIIVGVPITGRQHADLQPIIGIFVNMLAMRNQPFGDRTFRQFLREVKEHSLQAFANQDYQFEELVQELALERDVSRNPIFDVAFALQNMDSPTLEIDGLTLRAYEYETTVSRFDLLWMASEKDGQLISTFEYSSKLFKRETIERFVGYLREIVTAVIRDRDVKLGDIIMSHDLVDPTGHTWKDLNDFGF